MFSEDNPRDPELAVAKLLDQPKSPTIIIASNNDMALAVLRVAGKRQLVLGRDLSLVTIDDSQLLEAMSPGITVVARPVEQLSRIAVEKLVADIEQPGQPAEKIAQPVELVARGSVANLVLRPELWME